MNEAERIPSPTMPVVTVEPVKPVKPVKSASPPRVRLWPTWIILFFQICAIGVSITPSIDNLTRFLFMMIGPASCALLYLLWLVLASRLHWGERFLHLGMAAAVGGMVVPFAHQSMGTPLWIYGIPLTLLAITLGLLLGRSWNFFPRALAVLCFLMPIGLLALILQLEGFTGDYHPEFLWRWTSTEEPPLQAVTKELTEWKVTAEEWPSFRGPGFDSRVPDIGSPLDWTSAKPTERWRVTVGKGWSSFAYVSGRLFTQEQRDDNELVTCYEAKSGSLLWQFAHPNRFSDVVAGPGPRATPTFADGRLYTYGSKAVLSCLEASSGKLLWQRDLMKEVNAQLPVWGFSNSPLVMGDVVIIYAGGDEANGLVAYNKVTGAPAWSVASRGMNFSTAQRVVLSSRELVLFGDDTGLFALESATGKLAWKYKPEKWRGPAICQPQHIGGTSLIVPLGDGVGLARIEVQLQGTEWSISESWSTRQFKPSFNDFVYHQGHCYGFDQNVFVCLDAETGELKWRRGRYGFGQVLLLSQVNQLIVATEDGEAVLLAATPTQHQELGRIRLLEGKTWNHPIVVGNQLYLRNGKQAVCVDLVSNANPT